MDATWTDERRKAVVDLRLAGLTSSQIAVALKGVSRSAVCGILYRAGLKAGRPLPPPPRERMKFPPAHRTAPPITLASAVSGPVLRPLPPRTVSRSHIGVAELAPGMCKWPIGDPRTDDFHFCGEAITCEERNYCATHHKRAYGA